MIVEIALQYNDGYVENVFSFVNNINTIEGGTHLVGFRAALTRTINNYAEREGMLKSLKDVALGGDDVREGLTAVVSVKVPEPQFEGQTKAKLGNTEVKGIVESVVGEGLRSYFEENPPVARKIVEKCIATRAGARGGAQGARAGAAEERLDVGLAPRQARRLPAHRPRAVRDLPRRGRLGRRLGEEGRDRKFQAILPLKGKILNVEKASLDKMLANEEIRTIITALGTGIGDEFDADKARYHRIIIMTDADVDGAHIRTLLLTFFFRHMRAADRARLHLHRAAAALPRGEGQGRSLRLQRGGARDGVGGDGARQGDPPPALQGARRDEPRPALVHDDGSRDAERAAR